MLQPTPSPNVIQPPLSHLAVHGQTDAGRLLVKHGAEVNAATSKHQVTALMQAAVNGHCEFVQMLLEHDASVSVKCYFCLICSIYCEICAICRLTCVMWIRKQHCHLLAARGIQRLLTYCWSTTLIQWSEVASLAWHRCWQRWKEVIYRCVQILHTVY